MSRVFAVIVALAAAAPAVTGQEGFRFKSGVELINVTATVTDQAGRFVPGLRQEDFRVFEDGSPVEVTHFSAERVPVSLGLVVDTSGSMAGDKWVAAREAIERFLDALPDPDDEFFLYGFSASPELIQDWTSDRRAVSARLRRVAPTGGTAMYDAVAEAVPIAQTGRNRKKAVVVISDGNDTNSHLDVSEIRQLVRESEVLVYAVGVDGQGEATVRVRPTPPVARPPIPTPFPVPGGGRRGPTWPPAPPQMPPPTSRGGGSDRVNVVALREMTDDSGGRTEIVRSVRDLGRATAGIADELSRQYYLGYPSLGHRDGRWHTIRVEVDQSGVRVRARRGYVATP
ncbi:MAG: VWA domain-containing protein [Acidobacteriota bacterium]